MTQIAVSQIHPNPQQPRDKKVDVTDLVNSLPKVGLVQPIVVAKNGDGYVVIAGHRRLAAAKALLWETIECDVIDITDPKLDIGRIMAENTVRRGLSGKEQAAGFQTMIDVGWSDDDICAATGAEVAEVAAARAVSTAKKKSVAKMPETASLLEMAALIEFDGNGEAVADLTKAVGTDNFEHRLSFQRQKRADRHAVEEATAKLKAQDVRIIPESDTWDGRHVRLSHSGINQSAEEHAACPGHCAFIRSNGEVEYRCSAPRQHGIGAAGAGPKTDEQKAQDKLKRQMRALWRASAPVRQGFVLGKLKLKKVDAALFAWALVWIDHHGLDRFDGMKATGKDYTESKDSLVRVVATTVATAERAISDWVTYQGAVGQSGYHDDLVQYLGALGKMGYPLSDHERAFLDGTEYDPSEAAA